MSKVFHEGPLELVFKGSAMAAILDFLIVYKRWDYSKSDIAKNSGVNFRTVLRLLPKLEDLGIVKQTRRIGKAQMYQYNTENHTAKTLDDLAFEIAKHDNDKILRKESAPRIPT